MAAGGPAVLTTTTTTVTTTTAPQTMETHHHHYHVHNADIVRDRQKDISNDRIIKIHHRKSQKSDGVALKKLFIRRKDIQSIDLSS